MASPPPDRHACHCGKSFLRKEHLRRHQATHSGPAFSCAVCGRSFSRSDLLRRHAAIHGGAAAVPDSRRGRACDTCHANKTKCDGGAQCSLCAKRGVVCTYGRNNDAAGSPPAKRARYSSADDSAPAGPVSPPSTDPGFDAAAAATETALQSILAAVVSRARHAPRPGDPASPPPPSAVPRAWLAACVESYFGAFHDRWPVLHAPSLDETSDNVAIVASVVMIDCWLHHDRGSREVLMELHGLLVEQSFKQLAGDSLDPSRPWPVEAYQVALLNIIFAFESGRASCIKRARHLLSLLVAALRQNNCFSSEALERERKTHYPGDFVPWVFSSVEVWKRLAAYTFQIDAFLSLLCNQPPLLRREELHLGLTSTFGMWNAYGLHVFFPRQRDEPWRRGALTMSCLDMSAPQLLPSGLLVEDVQACLLGAWNDVWVLQQLRRNRSDAGALKADAVARQLKLCRVQLDALAAAAADPPPLHGPYGDVLLRAYAGREQPPEPGWRERVRARLAAGLVTARMLLHLLHMHLHADVQTVRDVAQLSAGAAASPAWQPKALQVQQWAGSADSRAALVHAMLVWRTYQDQHQEAAAPRREPADPVVFMAVSAAATVLWAWTAHAAHACTCGPEVSKVELAAGPPHAGPPAAVPEWVLHGGTAIMLHGVPVCKCNAAAWLTRFAEVLARGGERWELGSIAANTCLSKLAF